MGQFSVENSDPPGSGLSGNQQGRDVTAVILGFFGLLKAVAWPFVVLLVARSFKPEILSFLPGLNALLLRSRKVNVAGILQLEVDAAEQQQKAADVRATTTSDSVELREIPGLSRTKAIETLERNIHGQLKNVTEDPVHVLVRNLAQARLEAAFGFIYAGIFGSQILGLIHLEARRKVSTDEVYRFYQEVEAKYPEIYQGYGFAGWLGFLKTHGLTAQKDTDVLITPFGDDFLKWLQATSLSIKKPW
jgi:hypothetical protein